MARIGRSELIGIKQARENFMRLHPVCQEHAATATRDSAAYMRDNARLLVPVRFGALKKAIGFAFDKRSGLAFVGIQTGPSFAVGGRTVSLSKATTRARALSAAVQVLHPRRYGHLVEFGTSRTRAKPFMVPAAARTKPIFERNMRGIGPKVERDLSVSRFV